MPVEVYEQPLELEIELLEAGEPTTDSYPYPSLRRTGLFEARVLTAAVLENLYLRATFIPALGGRLYSLFDKRSNFEALGGETARSLVARGRRGTSLVAGVQLHLDGAERLTSLAPVQYAAVEGQESSLWLAEAVNGTGLSWHIQASMPADRATLHLEARIFNRTYREVPYCAGLILPGVGKRLRSGTLIAGKDGAGVAAVSNRAGWRAFERDQTTILTRFPELRLLGPRQLDTWTVDLMPCSSGDLSAVSEHGFMRIGNEAVCLRTTHRVRGKLVLLMPSGEQLETHIDAHPEHELRFDIEEAPSAAALLDDSKQVLLGWSSEEEAEPVIVGPLKSAPSERLDMSLLRDEELEDATFDPKCAAPHTRCGERSS